MKELKEFTVEQLERLIHLAGVGCAIYESNTIAALAKIALAAKQDQPVCFIGKQMLNDLNEENRTCGRVWLAPRDEVDGNDRIPLYTTPPLNHAEQDGWIKYQEQRPSTNDYISFVSRHGEYASGLVGEDEWVEMHDGTSFELAEIYIWLLLPPLPAAPKPEIES